MNRKLLNFLLVLALSHLNVFGQDRKIENLKTEDLKRIRFGYYVDLNHVGAKMEYLTTPAGDPPFRINIKPKPSFGVGLVADYRINEFINIRFHPGIAFVEREIIFPFYEDMSSKTPVSRDVKSNYVRFPIGIKFNTRRIRNARPFLMGSFSINSNITSSEKSTEDNESGTFRMRQRMNAWEFAIGTDVYLPYFKFTTSIHGVFALNNELVPDKNPNSPYTGYVKSMKSRGVFLRFTFE
jgi:hypothetical protein